MECSHEGILMNELIGIYASESQPKSQLAGAQLLYLAVDRCRDIIHVTNDQHVIQVSVCVYIIYTVDPNHHK